MPVIQASRRFPIPDEPGWDDRVDYIKAQVREKFGLALIEALTEKGGIVGPIHEEETRQKDWLWHSGMVEIKFTIYAKLTEMPEPENYRFMGGPADGRIGRTGGAQFWRVPYMPPISFTDPHDIADLPEILYADYERIGDDQVYHFKGINR